MASRPVCPLNAPGACGLPCEYLQHLRLVLQGENYLAAVDDLMQLHLGFYPRKDLVQERHRNMVLLRRELP